MDVFWQGIMKMFLIFALCYPYGTVLIEAVESFKDSKYNRKQRRQDVSIAVGSFLIMLSSILIIIWL